MRTYTLQLIGRAIIIEEYVAQKLFLMLCDPDQDKIPKFIGIGNVVIQINSVMGIFPNEETQLNGARDKNQLIAEAIAACGKCNNGFITINRNTVAQCDCIAQLHGKNTPNE